MVIILIIFLETPRAQESIDSSTRLKGCCVFPGRVKNRACVLEHIEDTRCLRSGDILIVKSVDIAWSPYFPIISGLVTEIGGIISHGDDLFIFDK
jgi:pyruvate,water dikinase